MIKINSSRKRFHFVVCVLSIALLFSTFMTPVFSREASATPAKLEPGQYEILMISRQFTPESGIAWEDRLALEVLGAQARAQGRERIHALVQLDYIPTLVEKDALARQGVILLEYIPNYTWIAAVPAHNPIQVAKLPGVRWVGHLAAADKTDSTLTPESSPWAFDADSGLVALYVVTHRDVPTAEAQELLARFGQVKSQSTLTNLYVVWARQDQISALMNKDWVSWVQPAELKWTPINNITRAWIDSDILDSASYGNADGTNVDILIYDGGNVLATHQELAGRVTTRDGACSTSSHSTHVACTTSASGVTAAATGHANNMHALLSDCMSTDTGVFYYTDPGELESDLDYAKDTWNSTGGDADGAELFNASVGSNTSPNGWPCVWEGNYGPTDVIIDNMVRGDTASAGKLIAVWANGNERQGSARCGSTYHTTAPPACNKNAIQVGATNKDADTMTSFSSWGPCDDGRIKPVVSAPGCATSTGIYSCVATGNTAYDGTYCGTSMASPAAAGVVAQLVEYCRNQGLSYCPTDGEFWPSSAKALLMHAAVDLGNTGPDYQFGYGRIEADATADLLTNSAPNYADLRQDQITTQGEIDSYEITVSGSPAQLKVSLAWDDEAATMQALIKLVNNLDLELVAPGGTIYRPYILDPNNPGNAATTGVDNINNQEQVVVNSPANGAWTIRVTGVAVPAGPQDYSIVFPNAYNIAPSQTPGTPPPAIPPANPSHCAEYITNGSFESGATGWNPSGSAAQSSTYAHAGAYSMRSGGTTDGAFYQDITVPSNMFYGTLSFWYRMQTSETTHPYDFFDVEVRNTSNQALTTLLSTDDSKTNGVWTQASFAIGPEYAGQTIRLHFSADVDTSVSTYWYVDEISASLCRNTAPTLNNSGSPYLTAINEDDTANSGSLVSAIIASVAPLDMITDPDTGAVEGLAVIGVDNSNGAWQYSTNGGGGWTAFGSPTASAARLLASEANTRIRFVPNANWNGTVAAGLTFRAWDLATGSNGGTGDTNANGSTAAFSTATETASITVNPVNDAPALDPIGDQSVDESSLLSFTATASDLDVPANGLSFSLDGGAPSGASINATTGEFTWTPDEPQGPGEYPVTARVTDDGIPALDDAETFTITVNEVNLAPTLDLIGDQSVDEGSLLSFTAMASDPDIPANELSFSLDAGAPSGASINATTGEFTWTPDESQGPGGYPVTARVTDDGTPALDDAETFTITVNEVADVPSVPVLISPPSGTITTTQAITFTWQAGAGDPPEGYNLQVDGAILTTTATVSPALLSLGVHTWTVRAFNAAGYSAWAVSAWIVEITQALAAPGVPVLVSPPNGTITTMPAITFTWQAGAGDPPEGYNLQVDGETFTTTNTSSPTLLPLGVHTWTVRAFNAAGYSAWVSLAWIVEITQALAAPGVPVLVSPPHGTVTTTQVITFTWQAGVGDPPEGYNLQLDGVTFTTTATISPALLPVGVYTWTARAFNAAGYSAWVSPAWLVEVKRYRLYLPIVLK